MKFLLPFILFSLAVGSCVPSKKYKDLLEKEQKCSEELSKYKTDALNFESDGREARQYRFVGGPAAPLRRARHPPRCDKTRGR